MEKRPTNKKLESMVSELEKEHEYDCSENIMDCIKSGRAKMRSRWLVLSEELGLKTSWVLAVLLMLRVRSSLTTQPIHIFITIMICSSVSGNTLPLVSLRPSGREIFGRSVGLFSDHDQGVEGNDRIKKLS